MTPNRMLPPAIREVIQFYSLRAHVALEELRRVPSPKWLFELGCYVDIAWQGAHKHFASLPKVFLQSHDALLVLISQAEQQQLPAQLTEAQWSMLCQVVTCADGVWSRVPPDTLVPLMQATLKAIESPSRAVA